MGMKQVRIFLKNEIGQPKKSKIFETANTHFFFKKVQGLVLGKIGLIDIEAIDMAKPYMVERLFDKR